MVFFTVMWSTIQSLHHKCRSQFAYLRLDVLFALYYFNGMAQCKCSTWLQVLRRCGYIGDDDTVQLKGRVTCELHSHEVLLTELIFQNVFVDYSPAEIAALLSAVIFQQVTIGIDLV